MMETASGTVKVIVFGAGEGARRVIPRFSGLVEVLAIADNDPSKQGASVLEYPVVAPARLRELPYDCVVVASVHATAITAQLLELGVDSRDIEYPPSTPSEAQLFPLWTRRQRSAAWLATGVALGASLVVWLS